MKPFVWISNLAFFVAAAFVGAILVLAQNGAAEDDITDAIERRMASIHAELDRRDAIDERFAEIKAKTLELVRRIRVMRGVAANRPAEGVVGEAPQTRWRPIEEGLGTAAGTIAAAAGTVQIDAVNERLERLAKLSGWTEEEREAVLDAYRLEAKDRARAAAEDRGDYEERVLAARSKRLSLVRDLLGQERFQRVEASLPELPRFELPREED